MVGRFGRVESNAPQMECFQKFCDVSDAIDFNSKYDWFKIELWSIKRVSLNNQARQKIKEYENCNRT